MCISVFVCVCVCAYMCECVYLWLDNHYLCVGIAFDIDPATFPGIVVIIVSCMYDLLKASRGFVFYCKLCTLTITK